MLAGFHPPCDSSSYHEAGDCTPSERERQRSSTFSKVVSRKIDHRTLRHRLELSTLASLEQTLSAARRSEPLYP